MRQKGAKMIRFVFLCFLVGGCYNVSGDESSKEKNNNPLDKPIEESEAVDDYKILRNAPISIKCNEEISK